LKLQALEQTVTISQIATWRSQSQIWNYKHWNKQLQYLRFQCGGNYREIWLGLIQLEADPAWGGSASPLGVMPVKGIHQGGERGVNATHGAARLTAATLAWMSTTRI
jgi:hypothetical protein